MLQNSFYAISGTFYTLLNNTDLYLSYFILSYVFLGHNDSIEWGLTVERSYKPAVCWPWQSIRILEVLCILTVVDLVYSLSYWATYLVRDSSQYPPWSKPSEILASFCNLSIVFTLHRCDYFQISILSCQRNSEWCGDLHPWPIL